MRTRLVAAGPLARLVRPGKLRGHLSPRRHSVAGAKFFDEPRKSPRGERDLRECRGGGCRDCSRRPDRPLQLADGVHRPGRHLDPDRPRHAWLHPSRPRERLDRDRAAWRNGRRTRRHAGISDSGADHAGRCPHLPVGPGRFAKAVCPSARHDDGRGHIGRGSPRRAGLRGRGRHAGHSWAPGRSVSAEASVRRSVSPADPGPLARGAIWRSPARGRGGGRRGPERRGAAGREHAARRRDAAGAPRSGIRYQVRPGLRGRAGPRSSWSPSSPTRWLGSGGFSCPWRCSP